MNLYYDIYKKVFSYHLLYKNNLNIYFFFVRTRNVLDEFQIIRESQICPDWSLIRESLAQNFKWLHT